MTPNKTYRMYATTMDLVVADMMSNVPSMTEQIARVASPNICQLKCNQPRPKDVPAPVQYTQTA
jgi:hypothetical protein